MTKMAEKDNAKIELRDGSEKRVPALGTISNAPEHREETEADGAPVMLLVAGSEEDEMDLLV